MLTAEKSSLRYLNAVVILAAAWRYRCQHLAQKLIEQNAHVVQYLVESMVAVEHMEIGVLSLGKTDAVLDRNDFVAPTDHDAGLPNAAVRRLNGITRDIESWGHQEEAIRLEGLARHGRDIAAHAGTDEHQPVVRNQFHIEQAADTGIGIEQVAVIRAENLGAMSLGNVGQVLDLRPPRSGFLAVGENNEWFHA